MDSAGSVDPLKIDGRRSRTRSVMDEHADPIDVVAVDR
jgi:hypothetical protein